jgi:hypothetical protein
MPNSEVFAAEPTRVKPALNHLLVALENGVSGDGTVLR